MNNMTNDLFGLRREISAQIHPVILSGGTSTRLWPLSRASFPKQFLSLVTERTLLQDTAMRNLNDIAFAAPLIVCHEEHFFVVEEQLNEVGVKPQAILLEPLARNTAPAIAVAAIWLLAQDPEALMLVQPADHVISNIADFHRAVMQALATADDGNLVIFGIQPSYPDTGYGYIETGAMVDNVDSLKLISRFIEKPDHTTLESLLKTGGVLWSSGIFLFRAASFLEELSQVDPAMVTACRRAVEEGQFNLGYFRLGEEAFKAAASISVDHAIMQHTRKGVVASVDMGWSDVGSWRALRGIGKQNASGNVFHGDVVDERVSNSYIRSEGPLVAVSGVDDLVIIATEDVVLVTSTVAAGQAHDLVNRLNQCDRPEAVANITKRRPWGDYRTVDTGERFQVKRITVKPGGQLSLQMHYHRAEHWIVVQGTAIVQCGKKRVLLNENESIYIPVGAEHRLENPGYLPLMLIEIQSGAYLGEDDTVRLADNYRRI
jgi:mannose-1-phosphate guanylyltransferase/mannose-6-phosphate isomerase